MMNSHKMPLCSLEATEELFSIEIINWEKQRFKNQRINLWKECIEDSGDKAGVKGRDILGQFSDWLSVLTDSFFIGS